VQKDEAKDVVIKSVETELRSGPIISYIVYCVDDNDTVVEYKISEHIEMLKFVGRIIKINKFTYAVVGGSNPPSITIVQHEKSGAFESFYCDVVSGILIINKEMSEMQNTAAIRSVLNKNKTVKSLGYIYNGKWWN
jgi:hypothetical protein